LGEAVSHCRQAKASVLPTSGKSPGHTSPQWQTSISLCTTASNLWAEPWPESERRELKAEIKKIEKAKRKQERLSARKKAEENAQKARIRAQMSAYHKRCKRECLSLGNREQTWECLAGRISGVAVPRRGHNPPWWVESEYKAVGLLAFGANLKEVQCKCKPKVQLPEGCSKWIMR